MVKARRGSAFDPLVCDVFLALSRTDVLWTVLRADDLASIVAELEPDDRIELLDESRLDRVAHAFAKIIDAKSPYTSQHSVGVAAYAVAIGSELGWAKDDLRRLRRAGLVHDIGKLGISSRILDKPGALSDDEFTKMQTHAALSYDILARVPALRSLAASAASHHERLDGSGYPRGLNGHDICLASRVLAVADIYEALTAERPYRAAMPGDQALKIVREQAPVKLWDEAVAALERSLQASVPTSLAA